MRKYILCFLLHATFLKILCPENIIFSSKIVTFVVETFWWFFVTNVHFFLPKVEKVSLVWPSVTAKEQVLYAAL